MLSLTRLTGSERGSSLAACSLLLLTPFVIFMRHHDYGLLQPEAMLSTATIALIGLMLGWMLASFRAAVRVSIASASLVLFVDLQLDWIETGREALALLLVAAIPVWFMRARIGRILAFASAVMIVATLPMPSGGGSVRTAAREIAAAPNADLPPIFHLVLDEHIAADAIPREFDPDARIANAVIRTYSDLGFRVFTRAFSRHFTTAPSLFQLMKLSAGDPSPEFDEPQSRTVRDNTYFKEMSRRGYRIDVLQSDYIDFCASDDAIHLARCSTYTLESPKAIADAPISIADKTRTIVGMFLERSVLHRRSRWHYQQFSMRARDSGFELPAWPFEPGRLSTVSAMQLLPKLRDDLSKLQPGTLYFAHLLLPHFPYAYDRTCALRPALVEWLTYKAPALRPSRNNPGTRAERYPLYLEQLECVSLRIGDVLRTAVARDALKSAIVIVHGDHGSRINLATPDPPNVHLMSPADFTDAFATHFALRMPGAQPGVDLRVVAIDELLASIVYRGAIPIGRDWIQSRDVMIAGEGQARSVRRPMIWTGDD